MRSRPHRFIPSLYVLLMLAVPVQAVTIDFNLDDGTIDPDFGGLLAYDSGVIQLPEPVPSGGDIWIQFRTPEGVAQHLEVIDDDASLESLLFFFFDIDPIGEPQGFTFDVRLTGVDGDTSFDPSEPFVEIGGGRCGSVDCNTSNRSEQFGDLTEGSFFFHDLHFENIRTDLGASFTSARFIMTAGEFAIGTWDMPEPSSIFLLGTGVLGIAGYSMKRRR